MAKIELKKVCKTYGKTVEAVKDFNLEIDDGEFVIFVGPSGCGKSTTLRMVAGLEEISAGELLIDGESMKGREAKDRDLAMVFQNYALYPHMTVYDNLAFGLKMKKSPVEEIDRKIREAAGILSLEALLDRKPKALSGGEKQRVAMGRAIVREAKAFLMDEPLSNLDAKLRVQMRAEIAKLHKRLGATIVYVTHDQVEAMTLGSRIVVMKDGTIQQAGAPEILYNFPCNQFVAGFIGSPQMNFLTAAVKRGETGYALDLGSRELPLPHHASLAAHVGKTVSCGIRPEDIRAEKGESDFVLERIEYLGAETFLYVSFGQEMLTVRAEREGGWEEGESVRLNFDASRFHLFDPQTGMRI